MAKFLNWKLVALLLALMLALSVVVAQNQTQLSGKFVGTVRLGPDKGMSWKGILKLSVASSGAVSGVLERSGAASVKVSGTAMGQSITLVFDLGGKYVFGTGGLNRDIRQNPTALGGTLSGPAEGDIGDWGYAIGG